MAINHAGGFPPEVKAELGHYLYRLIDPRNGETFYVGRGQNNRVFNHVASDFSDKGKRIHAIEIAGLEVVRVVHRHSLSKKVAKVVEAALIDAYPGLTNKNRGTDARNQSPMHIDEVVERHSKPMHFSGDHKILVVKTYPETIVNRGSVYEAVRGRWGVNYEQVKSVQLVLGMVNGVCKAVYVPDVWNECTSKQTLGANKR